MKNPTELRHMKTDQTLVFKIEAISAQVLCNM